jgi:hypothetical protein
MPIVLEDNDYNNDLEDRRRGQSRRQEDEGGGKDPWMIGVPAWVRGIAVLGTTAAIALYLVYQMGTRLPKIEDRLTAVETLIQLQHEAQLRQEQRDEQRLRIEQATCLSLAKTEAAAASCR